MFYPIFEDHFFGIKDLIFFFLLFKVWYDDIQLLHTIYFFQKY